MNKYIKNIYIYDHTLLWEFTSKWLACAWARYVVVRAGAQEWQTPSWCPSSMGHSGIRNISVIFYEKDIYCKTWLKTHHFLTSCQNPLWFDKRLIEVLTQDFDVTWSASPGCSFWNCSWSQGSNIWIHQCDIRNKCMKFGDRQRGEKVFSSSFF